MPTPNSAPSDPPNDRARLSADLALSLVRAGPLLVLLTEMGCRDPVVPIGPRGDSTIVWERRDARGTLNAPYADSDIAVFNLLLEPVVVALSAKTGTLRWEQRLTQIVPEGSPAAIGDLILVPSGDLFALDRSTGINRWIFSQADDSPGLGKVLVHNDRVFTVGRRLYAVSPASGQLIWQRTLGDRVANPTASGDTLFVTSRQLIPGTNVLGPGSMVALSASTGAVLWETAVGLPGNRQSGPIRSPAVTDSLVIFGTHDGRVIGLDRASGAIRWTYDTANERGGGVGLVGGIAMTTGADGQIYGLDRRTGSLRWNVRFGSGGTVNNPITVVGPVGYISFGFIEGYDEAGRVLWSHGGIVRNQPGYLTSATEAGGLLYIGGEKGLYALRPPRRS